jgi:hypothetical protein
LESPTRSLIGVVIDFLIASPLQSHICYRGTYAWLDDLLDGNRSLWLMDESMEASAPTEGAFGRRGLTASYHSRGSPNESLGKTDIAATGSLLQDGSVGAVGLLRKRLSPSLPIIAARGSAPCFSERIPPAVGPISRLSRTVARTGRCASA